jgi:hypothetical protein
MDMSHRVLNNNNQIIKILKKSTKHELIAGDNKEN